MSPELLSLILSEHDLTWGAHWGNVVFGCPGCPTCLADCWLNDILGDYFDSNVRSQPVDRMLAYLEERFPSEL